MNQNLTSTVISFVKSNVVTENVLNAFYHFKRKMKMSFYMKGHLFLGSTTQTSQAATQSKGDYFFTEAQYRQILGLRSNKDSPSEAATQANNAGKVTALSSSVEALNNLRNRWIALSSNAEAMNGLKDVWIVDSGATHHISSTLDLMSDVNKITDKGKEKVTLPNGGCAKIEHIGSSFLSAFDKLKNVLHVPDFKFNLMSVSKLTRDLSCAAIFLPELCVFQDLYNGRVKAIGKEDEGLYVLKGRGIRQLAAHVGMKVTTGDTGDLWHMRLGHASIPIMQHVPFLQNKDNLEASFLQLDLPTSEAIGPTIMDEGPRCSIPVEPVIDHQDADVGHTFNMEEINEPIADEHDADAVADGHDADESVMNIHDAEIHNDHVQLENIAPPDLVAPNGEPSSNEPDGHPSQEHPKKIDRSLENEALVIVNQLFQ
ncbi:hypothetical protein A4A49_01255 [Nicotiana attenuata]|uniref:Retrovirus-related Pol polyprotein from transposon TNT 1-94-like beta-barrel domain-containing protein n=1 Tax=Nicotiana attenuata TaxID=49451 RepID=A0A1J6J1S0_NICAT|nr:hypothetical protein A4A49_01255 [Nicotiana attenuata]